MTHQSRSFHLSGRRLVISLLMLLGLVASLVAGVMVWQRLHAPVYHHMPNVSNTGRSILYLSSPGFTSAPTLLTMVRTSDGVRRWHYSLSGALSTGGAPTIGEALANGQAVEVANGVIYFVNDTNPLGAPNREQDLLALRADNGAVLWRQPVQAATLELFGVSDGVVCLRVTQQQGSREASSTLVGYNAQTGATAWQRQGADVTGSQSTRYSVHLLDGILYVTGVATAASPSSSVTIHALLASTGQTLWRYSAQGAPFMLYPVAAESGIVALYTMAAGTSGSLIGVQESSGTVRWRYQTSTIIYSVPHGGANAPGILEQDGTLYFGTTASDNSLQLDSIQLSTGRLLWSQRLAPAKHVLWDLAVGNGSVYAMVVPQWVGLHPSFDGLTLASFAAWNGTLRWQDHPAVDAFPYIADTGDVVLFASSTSLAGLRADDGTTLWRRPLPSAQVSVAAGGTDILSSVASSGAATWTGSLFCIQQATGDVRWRDQYATGLGAVVLGP